MQERRENMMTSCPWGSAGSDETLSGGAGGDLAMGLSQFFLWDKKVWGRHRRVGDVVTGVRGSLFWLWQKWSQLSNLAWASWKAPPPSSASAFPSSVPHSILLSSLLSLYFILIILHISRASNIISVEWPSNLIFTSEYSAPMQASPTSNSCSRRNVVVFPPLGLPSGSHHHTQNHLSPAGCPFSKTGLTNFKTSEPEFPGEIPLKSRRMNRNKVGKSSKMIKVGMQVYTFIVPFSPLQQMSDIFHTEVKMRNLRTIRIPSNPCLRIQWDPKSCKALLHSCFFSLCFPVHGVQFGCSLLLFFSFFWKSEADTELRI